MQTSAHQPCGLRSFSEFNKLSIACKCNSIKGIKINERIFSGTKLSKVWGISFLILLSIWVLPLGANTIIFRNGEVVYGEVITQSRDKIIVRIGSRKAEYSKKEILRILYQDIKETKVIKEAMKEAIRESHDADSEADIKIHDFKDVMADVLREEKIRIEKEELEKQKAEKRKQESADNAVKFRKWRESMTQVLKSSLVPGWGQYSADRTYHAGFMLGSHIAIGGALFSQYQNYTQSMNGYKTNLLLSRLAILSNQPDLNIIASSMAADSHKKAMTEARTVNNISVALVILYIYNLTDAAVLSSAKELPLPAQGGYLNRPAYNIDA
jgi:hypothetical protein